MDQKIHRFRVGYEGDMLEIVNPKELKLDEAGGLDKAVWVNEQGVEQVIEWNETEKKYTILEVRPTKRRQHGKEQA